MIFADFSKKSFSTATGFHANKRADLSLECVHPAELAVFRRFHTTLRLVGAAVAWLSLACVVALLRAEGAPHLATWRDEQWKELRGWALNPPTSEVTAEAKLNLKYTMPSVVLVFSGILVRLFTGRLPIICIWGIATCVLSVLLMHRYFREKAAIRGEAKLSKAYLLLWALVYLVLYAFYVFLTGALLTA